MQWTLGPEDVDRIIFCVAVPLGFVGVGVYLYQVLRGYREFKVYEVITIFLHSGAFATGIVLMIVAVLAPPTLLRFPTFLGGLAITCFSAQALYHELFK